MKNNYHLDFLQGLFIASRINTAFFSLKKVALLAKIDFRGCHGNGQVEKRKASIFLLHLT